MTVEGFVNFLTVQNQFQKLNLQYMVPMIYVNCSMHHCTTLKSGRVSYHVNTFFKH